MPFARRLAAPQIITTTMSILSVQNVAKPIAYRLKFRA
jgi:hypothetical protein